MQNSQVLSGLKIFEPASVEHRIVALLLLALVAGLFTVLGLSAAGFIDVGRIVGPCGFKQRYGLPCPTCAMTTAGKAFVRGEIFEAFYIQPAGALLAVLMLLIGILSFITAVFGVYLAPVKRFLEEVKVQYIVLALIIIVSAGWAVTLARAMASK